MATKITDTEMNSDQTRHGRSRARGSYRGRPDRVSVSWLPGRLLLRNQAITAMVIAEVVVTHANDLADNQHKMWLFVDGWAAELGISGPHAVAEASLSPEDHGDMPRVRTLATDGEPARTGYMVALDKATGTATVRFDGETVTMPACHLQYAGDAPELPAPPWHLADDGSHWRAQLADGRTGVIRRVLGEDGESSLLFVPAVYESALDFVTGPECNGVLAAAQWVAEQAEVPR